MGAHTFHLMVVALHLALLMSTLGLSILTVAYFNFGAAAVTAATTLVGGCLAWAASPSRATPFPRRTIRALYIVYVVVGAFLVIDCLVYCVLGWLVVTRLGSPIPWDPLRRTRWVAGVTGVVAAAVASITGADLWLARQLVPPALGELG